MAAFRSRRALGTSRWPSAVLADRWIGRRGDGRIGIDDQHGRQQLGGNGCPEHRRRRRQWRHGGVGGALGIRLGRGRAGGSGGSGGDGSTVSATSIGSITTRRPVGRTLASECRRGGGSGEWRCRVPWPILVCLHSRWGAAVAPVALDRRSRQPTPARSSPRARSRPASLAQSLGGGGGNGGLSVSASSAIAIAGIAVSVGSSGGSGGDGSGVTATNTGTVTTQGQQSAGITAQSIGGGGGGNGGLTVSAPPRSAWRRSRFRSGAAAAMAP